MRAVLVLLMLAGVAHAGSVMAPAGWAKGTTKLKNAEVYVSPGGAIELVVTTSTQVIATTSRADATRAALDDVHGIARRAALTGSNVAEDSWQERTDATSKQAEGMLTWRDADSKVNETARIVLAGDATKLVAVTGECIARADAASALVTACTTALATLDPGIALIDRTAPTIAPQGTPPKEPLPLDPSLNATPSTPPRQAPSMSDGSHTPMPPISIPQEAPSTDRRPVLIGAGIVVLAGLFWWNMRRRTRHEREDQENDDDR